jgi:hypothetical protein
LSSGEQTRKKMEYRKIRVCWKKKENLKCVSAWDIAKVGRYR